MPVLSVVTAVSDTSLAFVDETWRSLRALRLPDDWDLQWCVQRDGPGTELAYRPWAAVPWVSLERSARARGAAAARNQALLRATGDLIWPIDADDTVEPGAFMVLSESLACLDVGWAAGAWLELPVDEARRFRFVPDSPGAKPPGWLGAEIRRTNSTPFATNPILYRRGALLGAGGWPAFDEWEDTILAVVVSNVWAGVVSDALIGRYRRHPGQTTAQARFKDPVLRARMLAHVCEVAGTLHVTCR